MEFRHPCEWPLDEDMADGWFDGLPYLLEDMRPQGFLGGNFARKHADLLQVPENPEHWAEDDVLHALVLLGSDLPGCYVLGEPALRQWLASREPPVGIPEAQVEKQYLVLAQEAMAGGIVGSSAGGEFPKFIAARSREDTICHVIVKFSGSDQSPGTQRWSDLLVCEHLALEVVAQHLQVAAARSRIYQLGGRTFLEVERFDRHGARGRSPVCSWAALNPALFALAGQPWTVAADALRSANLIDDSTRSEIQRFWHFGQLIANTDMHDGNLSFLPGLRLAPAYDMLPMLYAPVRGLELPVRDFEPSLPLPAQREQWQRAAIAAERFWEATAADVRISAEFRETCRKNAHRVAASRAAS